jgi:DNA-binding response OmpR family regulator
MRKSRILIVDDEPGLVRLMNLMLTRLDRYEVQSLTDATLALEAVVKFKPHLVLLDWVMPHLSGGDVAAQIRANPRVCHTRILFLTAIMKRQTEPGELAGLPAIAKPVGVDELVEAIEQQLREVA